MASQHAIPYNGVARIHVRLLRFGRRGIVEWNSMPIRNPVQTERTTATFASEHNVEYMVCPSVSCKRRPTLQLLVLTIRRSDFQSPPQQAENVIVR